MLLLLAALLVAQAASADTQGDPLRLTPTMLDGFYEAEHSTTLPGAAGPLSRELRWTQPVSRLHLWPALPGSGLLRLEYLNPAQHQPATLQLDDRAALALPPTPTLRTLRLLLPAASATVQLTQREPISGADRPLGMIISETRWSGLATGPSWHELLRLLPTLPLTILLLALLLWLGGMRHWRGLVLLLVLGALAALSWRWPWGGRALQPMLQGLLLCAIGGAGLARLVHRWQLAERHWRLLIGAVWTLSTLLLLTPTVGHDGVGYYAYLRSFMIDGDIRFANEFDAAQSPFADVPRLGREQLANGYTPNTWSVGPALYWTPFWLLAHGLVYLGAALGRPWRLDGYAPPYIVLIALATALSGLATMQGCFRLARRWWPPSVAALAAITVYIGSNLLFYAQLEGSFAHSLSAATTTWFVVAALALDDRPTLRRWLLLGLAAGAMIVTYWVTAMLLLVPLAVALRLLWARLRQADWPGVGRLAAGATLAAGAALLVCFPQMLAWRLIYGGWLTAPQGNSFITPGQMHLREVLLSPLYGLVWWTPAYALGLLGGVWLALRRPWPVAPLAIALLLYLVYNASLPEWFGNGGFGMRRLTPLAPLCALGLAALLGRLRRVSALALAAVIAGWGLQMTARYVVYELPHDPYVLMDLRVRDLVLTPQRLALPALAAMVRTSWLGRFVQAPQLDEALVLLLCLLLAAVLLSWWRRPHPQPETSLS